MTQDKGERVFEDEYCICCARLKSEHNHKGQCPETTYFTGRGKTEPPTAEDGVTLREQIASIIKQKVSGPSLKGETWKRAMLLDRLAAADAILAALASRTTETEAVTALREAAQRAHDVMHECTAVLTADDCKKVAAAMADLRAALTPEKANG